MGFLGGWAGRLELSRDWGSGVVNAMNESRFDDVNKIRIDKYIYTNL